jgi:hypothetical protein
MPEPRLVFDRDTVSFGGGQAVPHIGAHVLDGTASAGGMQNAQVVLCSSVALPRRLSIPVERPRIVFRHALAIFVHDAQGELSYWVSVLGYGLEGDVGRRVIAALVGFNRGAQGAVRGGGQ